MFRNHHLFSVCEIVFSKNKNNQTELYSHVSTCHDQYLADLLICSSCGLMFKTGKCRVSRSKQSCNQGLLIVNVCFEFLQPHKFLSYNQGWIVFIFFLNDRFVRKTTTKKQTIVLKNDRFVFGTIVNERSSLTIFNEVLSLSYKQEKVWGETKRLTF